jgi:hypothetical protein
LAVSLPERSSQTSWRWPLSADRERYTIGPAADADTVVEPDLVHYRKWISAECQLARIKTLRQQLAITKEEQVPSGREHCRSIRGRQPSSIHAVEAAEVHAVDFGVSIYEEQKVTAVRKKLRPGVNPLPWCLESRHRVGSPPAAGFGHRPAWILEKMMVPSAFHAPPSGAGTTGINVLTDPLTMSTRFA